MLPMLRLRYGGPALLAGFCPHLACLHSHCPSLSFSATCPLIHLAIVGSGGAAARLPSGILASRPVPSPGFRVRRHSPLAPLLSSRRSRLPFLPLSPVLPTLPPLLFSRRIPCRTHRGPLAPPTPLRRPAHSPPRSATSLSASRPPWRVSLWRFPVGPSSGHTDLPR